MTKQRKKTFLNRLPEWVLNIGFTIEYYFGGLRSMWICKFRPIKKAAIFYGHKSGDFAIRYAHRRHRKWKQKWDGKGRVQAVVIFEKTRLVVCSELEVKRFQHAGIIDKHLVARNVVKRAVYNTKRGAK